MYKRQTLGVTLAGTIDVVRVTINAMRQTLYVDIAGRIDEVRMTYDVIRQHLAVGFMRRTLVVTRYRVKRCHSLIRTMSVKYKKFYARRAYDNRYRTIF